MLRGRFLSAAVKAIPLLVVAAVLIWRAKGAQSTSRVDPAVPGAHGSASLAGSAEERSRALRAGMLAGLRASALGTQRSSAGEAGPPSESARLARTWMNDHYSAELENRLFERHFAKLEKIRLESEDDSKWSTETEAGVQQLFEKEVAPLGALEQVACRGYLCRVEASVRQPGYRTNITRKIQVGLHLEQVTVQAQRDQDRFVAYFAGQGRTLPEWDFEQYLEPEMAAAKGDSKLWPLTNVE